MLLNQLISSGSASAKLAPKRRPRSIGELRLRPVRHRNDLERNSCRAPCSRFDFQHINFLPFSVEAFSQSEGELLQPQFGYMWVRFFGELLVAIHATRILGPWRWNQKWFAYEVGRSPQHLQSVCCTSVVLSTASRIHRTRLTQDASHGDNISDRHLR